MTDRELTVADFTEYFGHVHECDPFPWQRRLTEQVLSERKWPRVIDLPTGTGKTAVLDTAVFALAARPADFPRRVVFVIDRRIVVDQVCKRADKIAQALEEGSTPLLKSMGDRLRALSDGGKALGVAALRGGIPIDNGWSRQPDEPWVLVSTVDQFGSRLLFRGYRVSRRMRPIHAGLAGNDCLVILDEVHLSVPFAETLGQIRMFEPASQLPSRFSVVEMSATPSNPDLPRFQLDHDVDIEECPELRRRVCAPKEAHLVSVQNHKAMPARIVKEVRSLTTDEVSTIGVVVNRVRLARDTSVVLQEQRYKTHLLTGRMRALDRVDALERIRPAVDPDNHLPLSTTDKPTVVVATQAIEVGADFSFDALITECAPVDSLRQRFGRLDRRGTYHQRAGKPAHAVIIGPKSVVAVKKPDPIYGESVRVTWTELKRRADGDRVDVSSLALSDLPDEATAPKDQAPLVLQTHMDAWFQTCPEPIVQPRVDHFLHGMERSVAAEVSIVWRRDLSPEVLQMVPPRQIECMQVPIGVARAWLRGQDEIEVADVPGPVDEHPAEPEKPNLSPCLRWEGIREGAVEVSADSIRPGDLLVVETARGGISNQTWDPGSSDTVSDLGDRAQLEYGRRATLRLDSDLINYIGDEQLAKTLEETRPSPEREPDADRSRPDSIRAWLGEFLLALRSMDSDSTVGWLSRTLEILLEKGFDIFPVDGADGSRPYYVLVQRERLDGPAAVDERTMDGSDEANSLQGTGATLRLHLDGVARRASRFAEMLLLPNELAGDLRLAGQLHDVGKVDSRFQEQLVGGDPVALRMLEEPLAKSLRGTRRVHRYPQGMRHELASLVMVESNSSVLEHAHDPDLVLYLIGTHHGYGRSLPQLRPDALPQELRYESNGHILTANTKSIDASLAIAMMDRFWRLVEKYGYYGLAWLEAIFRLADHRESGAIS